MLCYWILRLPDGTPAGLVRVQNDRVLLKPTASIPGAFILFSDDDAMPITPESEMRLPCPQAVLGMDGDRVTCFASAANAGSIASYRRRLSHFNTNAGTEPAKQPSPEPHIPFMSHLEVNSAEIEPKQSDHADSISYISTMQADSVSESAKDAQAFSILLQHADAFFAACEKDPAGDMVQNRDDSVSEQNGLDLFSQAFPGARWRYVDGTDVLPHYEGTWKQPNGTTLHILAVRGYAAPRPPRALFGFTRFLRDRDGTGYWLKLTPLP